MRCPRCGNENPAANRFCGSCGASLLSEPPSSAGRNDKATQGAAVASSAAPTTPARRTPASVSGNSPVITGPSFLGLNTPPPSGSRSIPDLRRDSQHGPPSGNLDYLLDDDDEPRSATGKIFLILIALALALGFGYLRWRHEGLSSLWASTKKPAVAQGEAPQAASDAPANAPDASASTSTGVAPNAATPNTSAATGAASPPAAAATDSHSSAGTTSPAGTAPETQAPPNASVPAAATDQAANSASPSASTSTPAPGTPAAVDSGSAAPAAESPAAAAPTPLPVAKPRPTPKPTPVKTVDPVTEAEKYIYGRGGARQDCERGLRMLRPVAEQSNPRAMIALGALYSTGVCTPRDLPTAYRWFALALRKQPDNQPLQENLQRLWAQMTQPERQLAVKLSQ